VEKTGEVKSEVMHFGVRLLVFFVVVRGGGYWKLNDSSVVYISAYRN
jgi:hypothetical protein